MCHLSSIFMKERGKKLATVNLTKIIFIPMKLRYAVPLCKVIDLLDVVFPCTHRVILQFRQLYLFYSSAELIYHSFCLILFVFLLVSTEIRTILTSKMNGYLYSFSTSNFMPSTENFIL